MSNGQAIVVGTVFFLVEAVIEWIYHLASRL